MSKMMFPGDLNVLRDAVYEDAKKHGLYEENYKNYPPNDAYWCKCWECAQRIKDEVKEALEVADKAYRFRKEADDEQYSQHYAEEIADVIITALSISGYLGIDIHDAVMTKIEVNKNRSWKHAKD